MAGTDILAGVTAAQDANYTTTTLFQSGADNTWYGNAEYWTVDETGTVDGVAHKFVGDVSAGTMKMVVTDGSGNIIATSNTFSAPVGAEWTVVDLVSPISVTSGDTIGVWIADDPGGYWEAATTSDSWSVMPDTGGTFAAPPDPLLHPLPGVSNGNNNSGLLGFRLMGTIGGGGDTTPPTLTARSVNAAGDTLTITADENLSVGAGGSGGFALTASGGAVTLGTPSGSGTTRTMSLSRTIESSETLTLAYTQPGDGFEDAAGNDLATFSGAAVTNSSTQDTTAPVLTSPTGAATGTTTASASVSTDESNGTLYRVTTTSGTAPSAAQVRAGNDHTGSAAADDASQAVSSAGVQNINASGLTPATTYYHHFTHQDAAGNNSAVVSSASFTTNSSGPSAHEIATWRRRIS